MKALRRKAKRTTAKRAAAKSGKVKINGRKRGLVLSKRQVNEYRKNGFIVLECFWNKRELQEWREAVEEASSERPIEWKFPRQNQADVSNVDRDYYDNVFKQRLNLWATNQKMKSLFEKHGAKIGRVACELEGIDGIRIWHDQCLIKEGWANPTSYHTDNPYWTFHHPNACSIWMALDDATVANGAMFMLPGSHKIVNSSADPFHLVHIGKNHGDYFQKHPDGNKIQQIQPTTLEMKAGSISFHNGLTVHGANPNNTPKQRRAMTCAFMPEGATFNGLDNVYTKEVMARYKKGDVLEDDELNPLLWSKTHPAVSFPAGLPNLKYSGHYKDPVVESMLSEMQKQEARKLGYIS